MIVNKCSSAQIFKLRFPLVRREVPMKKDEDELDADLPPYINLENFEKSLDWTLWNMYIINIDAKVRFDPGKALRG